MILKSDTVKRIEIGSVTNKKILHGCVGFYIFLIENVLLSPQRIV